MIDRVRSLERDVASLDEKELKRFASWFANYQQKLWDRRIAKDAKSGKLGFLAEEARIEKQAGSLRDV